jgi:hypothetical protein
LNVCQRTLAGLTLLPSAALLLVSLAGGVGVWVVKGPVTARVTRVLGRVEAAPDTEVRQRAEGLKSRALLWVTPAAVLISVVCFWTALSQVSLMSHAWSWWKH